MRDPEETAAFKKLSPKATERAVLKYCLFNPVSLYSNGIGLLGGVATALMGTSILATGMMVGGLALGTLCSSYYYLIRKEKLSKIYADGILRTLAEKRENAIKDLESGLEALESHPKLGKYARILGDQCRILGASFKSLEETLATKLNPNEITYSRYVSASEQVYLAVIDNALVILALLNTLRTFDLDYIKQRLKDNPEANSPLRKRIDLYNSEVKKIEEMLHTNEEALTSMDNLRTSLASLRINNTQANLDLETAMEEMQNLATKVHNYNH